MASGCSGTSAKVATDLLCDVGDGAPAVHDDVPLRDRAASVAYAPATRSQKSPPARSIRSRSWPTRASAVSGSISIRNVRSGSSPPTTARLRSSTASRPSPRPDALVGDGRVDVAVAHDGRAPFERRADHLLDVLRARGRVERRLGPRRDVVAVEDEVADRLAERRAPGLPRRDDVDALGCQRLGEESRLSGLAAAVEPFEGDEHPPGR